MKAKSSSLPSLLALQSASFLAGAAGIALEVLWMKRLAAGLGHELASSIVLVTALFAGAAFGSAISARLLDRAWRPARVFAASQILIGINAVLLALLFPWIEGAFRAALGPEPPVVLGIAAGFIYPFLLLLGGAVGLGASLPALERAVAPLVAAGASVPSVAGSNTLGGSAGALAAAFWVFPQLGFRSGSLLLGGVGLVAAALLALASRRRVTIEPGSTASAGSDDPAPASLAWVCALVGLLGMAHEIIVLRVLSQVIENTGFSFGAVLSVWLLGSAAGCALYRCLPAERIERVRHRGALLPAIAGACALEVGLLANSRALYDLARSYFGDGAWGVAASEMLVAVSGCGLSTLLAGALFAHILQAAEGTKLRVGGAAALNSLGAALGSLVTGTVLLPFLGTAPSLCAIACVYVSAAPWLGGLRRLAVLPLLAAAIFLAPQLRFEVLPPGSKEIYRAEGVLATVSVIETLPSERTLRVNRRFQMGGTGPAVAERRQGHLPILLHGGARSVCFLGAGTGITMSAAGVYPGLRSVGVELLSEVERAMPLFASGGALPMKHPAGRVIVADARRFIATSAMSFDVIVGDLFHPGVDGAGYLYTREHFLGMRRCLAQGGLVCQWLPLHQMDASVLRIIVRTFLDVFPEAQAWMLHFNVDIPVVGLVGGRVPPRLRWDAVEANAHVRGLASELRKTSFPNTLHLAGCFLAGPEGLRDFAGEGPLNTDDLPIVSFLAARLVGASNLDPQGLFLDLVRRFREAPDVFLGEAPSEARTVHEDDLKAFRAARDLYLEGLVVEARQDLAQAMDFFIESAGRSVQFTPAYARAVTIIQVLAQVDRESAKVIFQRLEEAQPAQPLGRRVLGPILEGGDQGDQGDRGDRGDRGDQGDQAEK